MNKYEKELQEGRKMVHAAGITFTGFKEVISDLLTPNDFGEDEWVDIFNDYAHICQSMKHIMPFVEFAEEFFFEWSIPKTRCQLKTRTD